MKKNPAIKPLLRFNITKWFVANFLIISVTGIFLLPQLVSASSITEENIINLTNQVRAANGLSRLTDNQLLTKAAYDKGEAIMNEQEFDHTINGRKFSSWIKDTGYKYSYVGENLAINFATAEGVMRAWLASPTHRKNLLNSQFREIGVAVLEGKFDDAPTILVVQIFGTPLSADALVSSGDYTGNSVQSSALNSSDVEHGFTQVAGIGINYLTDPDLTPQIIPTNVDLNTLNNIFSINNPAVIQTENLWKDVSFDFESANRSNGMIWPLAALGIMIILLAVIRLMYDLKAWRKSLKPQYHFDKRLTTEKRPTYLFHGN